MQGFVERIATDPSGPNWLVTASSRGHLTLWDMRFNLAVNSFQQPQVTLFTHNFIRPVRPAQCCLCFGSPCGIVCGMHEQILPQPRNFTALSFQSTAGLVQNYPVEALAPALATPARLGLQESSIAVPLVYVAAGPQEVGLWDIEQGKCHQVIH